MKTYKGRVSSVYPSGTEDPLVTVRLSPGDTVPRQGATVQLQVVLTNEDIGRRLRSLLTAGPTPPTGRQISELNEIITGVAGWPGLADLITEVFEA